MAAKRANQSGVWEYMDKVAGGKVQCRLCGKRLVYTTSCSTSSLICHLRSVHPDVTDAKHTSSVKVESPPAPSAAGPQQHYSNDRQEKISQLIVNAAMANVLPLSSVESKEFQELLLFLEPNYRIPCRMTMRMQCEKTKSDVCSGTSEVSIRKTKKIYCEARNV